MNNRPIDCGYCGQLTIKSKFCSEECEALSGADKIIKETLAKATVVNFKHLMLENGFSCSEFNPEIGYSHV